MKRTAVMASSLAGALVAALFTGPASAITPAAAPSAASVVPGSVPTAWSAKKPARGVLRVKVTGTGSYTIRAKGYRKTGTVTKSFRVKPGKYVHCKHSEQ